ncbi:MAG: TrkA family potassium uptake protein, partial [Evtepia sp.]
MKTFVVIGLGRFGSAVAEELCRLGNEVLAIDKREELVRAIADKVTHAVVGDGQDPEVLRTLGVGNYDCAIMAVSDDLGDSVLITLNLKDLGVKHIICKAKSHVHREVLTRIGADEVVFPEHEIGRKLAGRLTNADILNFIEVSDEYEIVEMNLPKGWIGRSLRTLDVRAKYHINIVAIRGAGGVMHVSPDAD